jgi:hypothetical protein
MIPDVTFDPPSAPFRPLRLRFSLLALFIFITLICLLLAWWVQPNRVVATALFRVSSDAPTLLGGESARPDQQNFEILKKTQLALLKSHVVLNSAVRKPGIASLSIFAGEGDPVDWLQENIIVEFPQDAEILSISIRGVSENATDLTRIVDAVAKAYIDEVIYKDRAMKLSQRDLLARSLENLNKEISDKWEVYLDIARESGRGDGDSGDSFGALLMKRLDRVESELMRLEDEQLRLESGGEPENSEFYEKRIAQLRERQAELEQTITKRGEKSVELTTRKDELDRLLRVADEMASRLEKLEIESQAPLRIEQVQQAVVSQTD